MSRAQDLSSHVKQQLIRITVPGSLNDTIYREMSVYPLIMMGEMHGMNEPAEFLISLIKLMTSKGDQIQVGLEIPAEKMALFFRERSDSSIYQSDFFKKPALYGTESEAVAKIIETVIGTKNADIFFFDMNKKDGEISANRDSLMYLNIKRQLLEHPDKKTLVLTGNIHNMLRSFRGQVTMGMYLNEDKELGLKGKICSIKHQYKNGMMVNNQGKGLMLRSANTMDTEYSTAVTDDMYLLPLPIPYADQYNWIYFTRNVTAARMVNESLLSK
jgi:hypothetical protein